MLRRVLKRHRWLALALACGAPGAAVHPHALGAQEHPARRVANIVAVAVEEYALGIDTRGRLISDMEYKEAVDFLEDARQVAARLSGDRAEQVRLLLDSLAASVEAKRPSGVVREVHARFVAALGSEGALELPARALDLAAGRALYERHCASCHGARGLGDGPAAGGMDPAPSALADARAMADATPALLYRVIAVGVRGTQMPAWESVLSAEERWDIVAYLHALRATPAAVLEGEGLFLRHCAACHGAAGAGDGAVSGSLSRFPPELGSFAWQVERSDAQIATAIRDGIPATAMPATRDIAEAELAKVVAFVRTLPVRSGDSRPIASGAGNGERVARNVLALVDQALGAARSGRSGEANDLAFDAYIAFEPLETPARARSPGLVATMERHFAELKGAVRNGDMRSAERARDAIDAGLPQVVALTRRPSGARAAFLQSLLIILREGFEAILVVGAVVAFLIKTGNRHRLGAIWMGVGLALVASAGTAVVLQTALRALPATREVIEGVTMLIAVVVLFSVSYWLISKVEAAKWQQFIREKVNNALRHGGGRALAAVAFLAVYREGAETALFYQALFAEGRDVLVPIVLGILVGFCLLGVIFTLFYRFGIRIPLRPFFAATSVLLYYLAFVFMGKGIRELQEGGVVPITLVPGVPNLDALGIYATVETLLGQLLLVGLFVFALAKTFWPKRSVALPTAPLQAVSATDLSARIARLEDVVDSLGTRVAAVEQRPGASAGVMSATAERSTVHES